MTLEKLDLGYLLRKPEFQTWADSFIAKILKEIKPKYPELSITAENETLLPIRKFKETAAAFESAAKSESERKKQAQITRRRIYEACAESVSQNLVTVDVTSNESGEKNREVINRAVNEIIGISKLFGALSKEPFSDKEHNEQMKKDGLPTLDLPSVHLMFIFNENSHPFAFKGPPVLS